MILAQNIQQCILHPYGGTIIFSSPHYFLYVVHPMKGPQINKTLSSHLVIIPALYLH